MSEGPSTTRSMVYDLCAGIVLEVHPDRPPDDADWDAFSAWLREIDVDKRRLGLAFAEGPGPNASQRKKLLDVPGVSRMQTVVLTTSVIARGAITALNWLGYSRLVGRDYADLEGALDHLALNRERRAAVIDRTIQLKCALLGIEADGILRGHDVMSVAKLTIAGLAQHAGAETRLARPSDSARV